MSANNHVTVEPPSEAEQLRNKRETALELLRVLDEEWEEYHPNERRWEMRNAMKVLE